MRNLIPRWWQCVGPWFHVYQPFTDKKDICMRCGRTEARKEQEHE